MKRGAPEVGRCTPFGARNITIANIYFKRIKVYQINILYFWLIFVLYAIESLSGQWTLAQQTIVLVLISL